MAAAAAAASATAAISGALLPHAVACHRLPPRPQLLAVSSSFRRLSLTASPRRAIRLVPRADASAEAGEPEPAAEAEAEAVAASTDAEVEEGEAEAAVAVAEEEQEEEDEPPPPSKPPVKFGEIIGVSISLRNLLINCS